MLSFFIGLIGSLIALIGWFGFQSLNALVVGFFFYVVETVVEWKNLNVNAKCVDVLIFAIGSIIGLFINAPFYICGLLAVMIYSGIISVISLIAFINIFRPKL